MRFMIVLAGVLLGGGCATVRVANLTAKTNPVLAIDGKQRAIRISLGRTVSDYQYLYHSGRFGAGGWRTFVGQAFTDALGRSFVVVTGGGPEVLELRIQHATARLVFRHGTGTPHVEYAARLEDASGQVLARAAGIARGSVAGTGFSNLDETAMADAREALSQMLASAVEEFVHQTGAAMLPSIPEGLPASSQSPTSTYVDAIAPAEASRCDAEGLPEWSAASAAGKRELLRRCQK